MITITMILYDTKHTWNLHFFPSRYTTYYYLLVKFGISKGIILITFDKRLNASWTPFLVMGPLCNMGVAREKGKLMGGGKG